MRRYIDIVTEAEDVTASPAFRAWFRNSKVVDENGKPLVLYHGGRDWRIAPGVTWLTDDPHVADGYADQGFSNSEIKPLYARIEKPLDLRNPEVIKQVFPDGVGGSDLPPAMQRWPDEQKLRAWREPIEDAIEYAKQHGYDGVIHPDSNVYNRGGHTSYVIFSPNQVKAARFQGWEGDMIYGDHARHDVGNKGTYSDDNPHIEEQLTEGRAPRSYIRFGDIPEGERSSIGAAPNIYSRRVYPGDKEKGVSVFDTEWSSELNRWMIVDVGNHSTLMAVLGQHRPAYRVTGRRVGIGIDEETLLRDVKVIEQLPYDKLWVSGWGSDGGCEEFLTVYEAYDYNDEWVDDEDIEDDVPALEEYTLRAGEIVLHGTNGDFEERHGLSSPVWVTNSEQTARYFAGWKDDEGKKRITQWRVARDVRLAVLTREYFDYMSEYHDIELDGTDATDVLQHLRQKGFEGWIIPDNYGTQEADICLDDADVLEYEGTELLEGVIMESAGSTYYHVTFAARVPKIQLEGITPGKRRNWNNMFGGKLGSTSMVYIFTDPVAAARWAFKMEWEFKKPVAILVLKGVDTALEDDPGAEPHQYVNGGSTWKCTASTIPASCIERVVPMTREIAQQVAKVTKGEIDSIDI